MQQSLTGFRVAALFLAALLAIGGFIFSKQQNIPAPLAAGLLTAVYFEAVFFIAAISEPVRTRLEKLPTPLLALGNIAATVATYLIYSLPAHTYQRDQFVLLLCVTSLISLWYLLLGHNTVADLGYLILIAFAIMMKVFPYIYGDPIDKLPASIIGELAWTRTLILTLLLIRKVPGVNLGALPAWNDIKIGVRYFLAYLPIALLVNLAVGFANPRPGPVEVWRIAVNLVANLFGMYFFVALREEFVFRGILQNWLGKWTRSTTLALILASLIFGAAHLPFRAYPNWKFAILATIAGLFYGRAYQKAETIRAAMVTHALTNVAWRLLF